MPNRSTPKFTRRDFEFIADYIMPHMSWALASSKLLMNSNAPILILIGTNL